jgi:hypothetical protein
MTAEALFILEEAAALGIHVGTDGEDLLMIAPMRVPGDVRRWFETQLNEYRREIIAAIQRDNMDRWDFAAGSPAGTKLKSSLRGCFAIATVTGSSA